MFKGGGKEFNMNTRVYSLPKQEKDEWAQQNRIYNSLSSLEDVFKNNAYGLIGWAQLNLL